ncbi:uncharacterized protein [Nicotiana tomentosiformis]|uniref:uncharacterized protein n=1 Tax=Nicotiana tomentosiformis TaxID=4098 RepID=UPI00051B4C86|nr:uncharacterized protein LOC117277351 [Nicotiana tomentosiformis]
MHASDTESVELASYRLRDVAVQWYETWELSRGTNAHPAECEEFLGAFLHHYLPVEIRQARVDRFLALKQGNMSVQEYSLQFDSFARYVSLIVAKMSDRVHRFVVGLGPHLINECFTAALLYNIDIFHIQAYAQNLEDWEWQQYENRDKGQRKNARSARQPEDFLGDPMPPYPIDSVRQLQRPHYERSVYSESGQGSRISGFQNQRDSTQMRTPPLRCSQCGKAHFGQRRQGSNVCYTCGDSSHYMRDCPMKDRGGIVQPPKSITVSSSSVHPLERGSQASAGRGRGSGGASSSGGSQNCMYALACHQDP